MKKSGDSTVTIGIPTYERVRYLVEAVDSALNQTVPPDEIIISQNANPDPETDRRVFETIRSLAGKSDLIRINRNEERCNLSTNINSIADLARSKYIAIIGDDDRLKLDFIESVAPAFAEQPDVVFGDHDIICAQGQLQPSTAAKLRSEFFRDQLPTGLLSSDLGKTAAWRRSIPIFSCAIKTSTLKTTRLQDNLFAADTEFFTRLAEQGGVFSFVDRVLTEIRYHPGNIEKTGVQFAKLVDCLSRIPVDGERVGIKRDLISEYTIRTVKKLILEGDVTLARQFVNKHAAHVSHSESLKIGFQRFCLMLPDKLAIGLFSTGRSIARSARKIMIS